MNHTVKCHGIYFERVIESDLRKRKTVEVRYNDRDYKEGDTMTLLDWDPDNKCGTGKWAQVLITHTVGAPWLEGNMVALSILLQESGWDVSRKPTFKEVEV